MNETIPSSIQADASRITADPRARVPDTSMLPHNPNTGPAPGGRLDQVVQGAHHTIDRFADSAAPAVRQLSESVAAAGQSLHSATDRLRVTRDDWVASARCNVRSNPLVSIAAAFALGAVIARITR
jgi:hypothetical protein